MSCGLWKEGREGGAHTTDHATQHTNKAKLHTILESLFFGIVDMTSLFKKLLVGCVVCGEACLVSGVCGVMCGVWCVESGEERVVCEVSCVLCSVCVCVCVTCREYV